MYLLKVKAKNFKNLSEESEIDFVAKARKTSEDKEYELQEIAPGLFVYTTMAFVGKNASGKTTALDLLNVAYDILSAYRLQTYYNLDGTRIIMYFYNDGFIYYYSTNLRQNQIDKTVSFTEEILKQKKYYSSYSGKIYDDDFEPVKVENVLPDDVSSVFSVLKEKRIGAVIYNDSSYSSLAYDMSFDILNLFGIDEGILKKIIKIFDENISDLKRDEKGNYQLIYRGEEQYLTPGALFRMLSSGTTKGILLYILIVASLKNGFSIIIDEIENHFHKTLVENIISLYKDKSINKKNATLIFSTHYCEILDLFNRQDNIYVANATEKVNLSSIYDKYGVRNDILKSRLFYNGEFKTSVNYEALMDLKKELK